MREVDHPHYVGSTRAWRQAGRRARDHPHYVGSTHTPGTAPRIPEDHPHYVGSTRQRIVAGQSRPKLTRQ